MPEIKLSPINALHSKALASDKMVMLLTEGSGTSGDLVAVQNALGIGESGTVEYFSAGTYTLPTLTPSGGNLVVGTGDYIFSTGVNGAPPYARYTLAGGSFALTQNAINFIIADYNGGSPLIRAATTNADVDNMHVFPVALATYDGTNIALVDLNQGARSLANKMELRFARTRRIEVESGGLILGESATPAARTVTITTGKAWFAATNATLAAFNSSDHEMEFYYHVSGVWTSSTATQYNNSQYDNGTALTSLNPNRYAVNWIYRTVAQNQTKCFMVLGTGNYTLGQAQVAAPPSGLPAELVAASVLVGRIIVANGASSATQIDSAFSTTFTAAGVTDHASLSNLQGGTTGEYYHLTAAEKALIAGVFSGTGTLDYGSISAGAEATLTVTVTGAAIANTPNVALGWASALPDGIVVKQSWVSADNTVSVRLANVTASPIDPPSLVCRATVRNF